MSASNWRKCPRCIKERAHRIEQEKIELAKSYGKVTADEYEKKRRAIQSDEELDLEDTLREDYSQGMGTDGTYRVTYLCKCQVCDFTFKYKHEEPTT